MAAQLQGFCRFGLRVLAQLRDPQPHGGLETLVFDFSQHLQQQAIGVLLRQWKLPDNIARLADCIPPQQDALNPFAFSNRLLEQLAQQLKEPRLQAIATELEHFNRALARYQSQLQQVHVQASSALLQQLQQQPAPDSLSQLHAQWVECYEQAYGTMLQQRDYQQLYAELTNSSLRLIQLGRSYWQHEYRQLGLVPQRDYDDLLRNHHSLRKQLRRSEEQQQAISERLAQLERQVSQQQNSAQPLPATKPPVATLRKRKA
nr:poly(R)-hydroxyalkanoic acid synthase subunit PhaE [Motiliproteus sediminis]